MSSPPLPSTPHGRAHSRPPAAAATSDSRPRRRRGGDPRAASSNLVASNGALSAPGVNGNGERQLTMAQKTTMALALVFGGLVLVAGVLAWRSSNRSSKSSKKKRSRKTSKTAPPPTAPASAAHRRPAANFAPSPSRRPAAPQSSSPVQRSRAEIALSIKNEGNLLYQKKDHINAIRKYTEALRYADGEAEVIGKILGNRVLAYLQVKKYEEACADANEMARLNPQSARAYQLRGISLQELNEYEKAADDFRKAVDMYSPEEKGREKCLERLRGLEATLEMRSQKSEDAPTAADIDGVPASNIDLSSPVVAQVTSDSVSTPDHSIQRASSPPYKILERPSSSSPTHREPDIPYKTVVFSDVNGGGAAPVKASEVPEDISSAEESFTTEVMPQTHTFDDVMGVGGGSVGDPQPASTSPPASVWEKEVEADESFDFQVNGQKIELHTGEQRSEEPLVDEPPADDHDTEEVDLSSSSLLSRSDANWQVVAPSASSTSAPAENESDVANTSFSNANDVAELSASDVSQNSPLSVSADDEADKAAELTRVSEEDATE